MYHAIAEEICDTWRNAARKSSHDLIWFSGVFDNVLQDIFREQAVLLDQDARNLSTDLKRFYKTFFRDAEANGWRHLKTVAGSQDQPVRRDFPPSSDISKLSNPCSVPGSIMIVL
ncbi:hypothetical protein PI124_g15912 [Phytophthora idaei]|nr:hypothetical protein PI124_g15912 [Phytophthora idaei]